MPWVSRGSDAEVTAPAPLPPANEPADLMLALERSLGITPMTGSCKRENHTLCTEAWCECECHKAYRQ